ncbi:hypothetical protein Phi14:2_gp013 [Cellulophaga phage phi14:2]|uniref:Uncharacterized protein n=1 Tax=Cellulophaga phage phi14:2 TaxID=1327990 RepID=S0A0I7_9CAUD|nr:hypothetical protein Phi14:2_gp013 [Cellulophaga phage phi14:2]
MSCKSPIFRVFQGYWYKFMHMTTINLFSSIGLCYHC